MRETTKEAEAILDQEVKVLDQGFVRLVDYMGGDHAIEQAARVSYDAGSGRKVSETRGLIRYLLRLKHTTPFEMCELKFHCKMPIFVARQWIRHRTANVNELSGRYSVLPEEFYMPSAENLKFQSKTNKQGRAEELPSHLANEVLALLKHDAENAFYNYKALLGEHGGTEYPGGAQYIDSDEARELKEGGGLAKELARMGLPLSTYTQWYWKIDLHNLMHFLKLRVDAHAQYEIRVFAEAMLEIAKKVAPMAMEAFEDYVLNAVTFSRQELRVLGLMLESDDEFLPPREEVKAILGSDREMAEFSTKLEKIELATNPVQQTSAQVTTPVPKA